MPGYDGKGPQGHGPMTGGGMGYCMLKIPRGPGEALTGFAGLAGNPLGFPVDSSMADVAALGHTLRQIQLALQDLDRRISAFESAR